MPALPFIAGVLKLNVHWGVEADVLAQTIHFFKYTSGAPSSADLASFAAAAVSVGESEFQALCSDQVGMLSATALDLSSAMGEAGTGGSPWLGTRGTSLLPPSAAAVVSHTIPRRYRGGHPRTYLPLGVSGDVSNAGLWSDAFVTAVGTAWGVWANGLPGGSPYGSLTIERIVNVSYYGPPNRVVTNPVTGRARTISTVRAVPIVNNITGHTVRKMIGSQRRRNRDA